MASPEDYIIRFTDPARSDGELDASATFIIKPFTVDGPQHPIVDVLFTDPETGTAISKQSPIVLFGKGVPEYGEQMANNLLQVAENFAGASQPLITTTAGDPLPGVTWWQDEKYWAQVDNVATPTVLTDLFVWDDDADDWVDVTTLASTLAIDDGDEADRSTEVPLPQTGNYFIACDTIQLSVFYTWSDFTPTIQAWLDRITRVETFAPTVELPRRTLSVFDPTVGTEDFNKLISYRGNDAGDPMIGDLFLNGAPTAADQASTKDYVDTEIAAAIGGSNELFQLLDVDPSLDASTGNTPPPANGQVLMFDTGLSGGGFDGLWTSATLVAADIFDFTTAADARIAAAVIDDLSDVIITGPANGEVLTFSGGNWINSAAGADVFIQDDVENAGPRTVDGAGEVTLPRNDAATLTIENITPLGDFTAHEGASLEKHDADEIDWVAGALPTAGGPPTDVEDAILLVDAAIGLVGTGYTTIRDDISPSGAVISPGNGETPTGELNIVSGTLGLTVAVVEGAGVPDRLNLNLSEPNIDHDNLLNSIGVEHINHNVTGINVDGLIAGQDETNYDGAPGTEGIFAGGTGHAVADVITLADGSTITVDAEAAGVVTAFTVTTSSGTTATVSVLIALASTTGGGVGFTITPEVDNIVSNSGLAGGGNSTATRNLVVDISGTTTEVTVDGAADLFLMFDDSAGELRAVLGSDLPGAGGADSYSTITGTGANASGTASASGSETLNLASANNIIGIVISTPGTDLITFTFEESNLSFTQVADDTTPELGGNLDVMGNDIISVANGDINILPNGTGVVNLHSLSVQPVATVQTTDATETSLQVITIPADTERVIVSRAHCNEPATDDSAWFFSRFGVKNVGGTVSLLGGVSQDTGADAGASTWTVTVDVTGATVRIRVTGEAAHTINWETTTEVS